MRDYRTETAALRQLCAGILEKGTVDVVVAWTEGEDFPRVREMAIWKDRADLVQRIVWSPFCTTSTVTYLKKNKATLAGKKIAVVVKDCDFQALNVLLQEYFVKRENLVIIGARCDGLADAGLFPRPQGQDITITSDAEKVHIGKESRRWEDFGFTCCQTCSYDHMKPDHSVGEYGRKKAKTEWKHLSRILAQGPDKRREHYSDIFEACIRCYACREVCPVCACVECAIDPGERAITPRTPPADKALAPVWASRERHISENAVYLTTRAMHMAGRCVRCGWCERACPVGLPLMDILDLTNDAVGRIYGYEAGKDPSAAPFLVSYSESDPDDKGARQ
jgi:formate dehydrogenase subunit beta